MPAKAVGNPPEQLRLGVGGQGCQPKQVSYFDRRQRPIGLPGHVAIRHDGRRAIRRYVNIKGLGFFDEVHGQTGVAPNGIELHPVTRIRWR